MANPKLTPSLNRFSPPTVKGAVPSAAPRSTVGPIEQAALTEKQKRAAGLASGMTSSVSPHQPAPSAPASGPTVRASSPGALAALSGLVAAEPTLYPDDTGETFSLSDASDRERLVTEFLPQINDISAATNNGPDICAGAAVVNALVLTAHPPAKPDNKFEKEPLYRVFVQTGATLPEGLSRADVERAMKALRSGRVTSWDGAVLQQVAYAALTALQAKHELLGRSSDKGISPAVLGAFLTRLGGEGAKLGGARFTLETNGTGAHWTVKAGDTKGDSLPGAGGRAIYVVDVAKSGALKMHSVGNR